MALLSDEEIKSRLSRAAGWERQGKEIRRVYSFPDFKAAMAFVNRVADLAEAMDHHPDIDIRYSRVTLALSTHSAGGLTARDFDLAEKIGG
jgi:4a-hydroxytetrahydrobiopterin dehydratase